MARNDIESPTAGLRSRLWGQRTFVGAPMVLLVLVLVGVALVSIAA